MSDLIEQDSIARNITSNDIDNSHFYAEFEAVDENAEKYDKHVHAEFGSDHHIILAVDDSTGSSKPSEKSSDLVVTPYDPTEKSIDLITTSADQNSTPSNSAVELTNYTNSAFVATHGNQFQ